MDKAGEVESDVQWDKTQRIKPRHEARNHRKDAEPDPTGLQTGNAEPDFVNCVISASFEQHLSCGGEQNAQRHLDVRIQKRRCCDGSFARWRLDCRKRWLCVR